MRRIAGGNLRLTLPFLQHRRPVHDNAEAVDGILVDWQNGDKLLAIPCRDPTVACPAPALVLLAMIDGNLVVHRWRDDETMWRSTATAYPTSPMAHEHLGLILQNFPGKEAEAEEHCRAAVELNPALEGARACLATLASRNAKIQ